MPIDTFKGNLGAWFRTNPVNIPGTPSKFIPNRPRPKLTTFEIASTDDTISFKAFFADGSPMVTDGYGGWEVVARPREIGILQWKGRNPIQIEIPFMIDHWMDSADNEPGIATEAMILRLENLCGLGGHAQPPICTVDGNGVIPHDETNAPGAHLWVVENVSWDRGMDFRSGDSGRRVRAGGTITIRKYLTAQDILARLGPRSRARSPEKYIVKKGDTLSKIAALKYKDPNKWKRIADANGIRDSRSLAVGQHIIIPR